MNIFYLDTDPALAARQICDVHVRKMIIESCQMLSTAHHMLDGPDVPDGIMKCTHFNHPSNIWVRQSDNHYKWLYLYTLELCKIHTERSGKIHKCFTDRMKPLAQLPVNMPHAMFTLPPACMPDEYKHKRSVVRSYRAYLNGKYLEWTDRDKPIKIKFQHGKPEWLTSV